MKFKVRILIIFFALLFSFCGSAFAVGHDSKFIKVVFVGNYRCGKTAIWRRTLNQDFDPDLPKSDSLTFAQKTIQENDTTLILKIWDTAGLDKYYNEMVDFTKNANFVFIVHDMEEKYDESVEQYLDKIYRDVSDKIAKDGKIVFVGSKIDTKKRSIVNYTKQAELIKAVAKHIPCHLILTSAKTGYGIADIMLYIKEQSKEMELLDIDVNFQDNVKKFDADILERTIYVEKGYTCSIL